MTEFDDVIRLLREQRPEATPLELDHIKQRVRRRAEQGSRRNQPMKSRLAVLGMLVVGILFSTTGAGIALTSLTGSSAQDQYGSNTPPPPAIGTPTPGPSGGVKGEHHTTKPGSTTPSTPSKPSGGVEGVQNHSAPTTALAPTQQVAAGASSNQLPFTGFAAIPVILIGIGLLSAGLVLRRRTARGQSD